MSSTALKVFAAVAVLAAVILAAVGYRMSRDYAQKSEAAQQKIQQQEAEQTLAVVAIKPLGAYKPIPRDALALVPVAVKPADPYASIDEVAGKQPLVDIDMGAPITRRYFREGNMLARAIPPGFQAVSINVTDVLAVGGFLRPGDVVDILIFIRGGEGVTKPQSRVLLEKVRVLAYLEQIVDRPEGVDQEGTAQRQSRTAVLAIAESDTTKLMLGSSLGELRLALHGQGEELAAADAASATATAGGPIPAGGEPAAATVAVDTGKPKARPEKVITSEELARIKPPPGARTTTQVEIYRGNERSAVVAK